MKTIIAGSRDITSYNLVATAIHIAEGHGISCDTIISGGCRGVDQLAIDYAVDNAIYYSVYPADWSKFGKAAGPIRNRRMAENAHALIAIWDGKSKGTLNMINTATELGLKVYVHRINP